MTIFDGLAMLGGLALFLFGMHIMGGALEKEAGGRLKSFLANITANPIKGFFLGLIVTAIIQSSSATTVMVVGLVSAGVLTLRQSVNIIIGANVGTTVTSWILSLTGIEGDAFFLQLLKPSSFTPVLGIVGIVLLMMCKSHKKQSIGTILIGFATLMFGMEAMSDAVSGLKDVPEFGEILITFSNPLLGVLAGAILTAIVQSSSASVGILQALCSTGMVTYASVLPIIMGQNIGTCVTALISSAGSSKNAKRAAMVHLYFNLLGSILCLALFYIFNGIFHFAFVDMAANEMGIAIIHTAFNIICTLVFLPLGGILEKLAKVSVKDAPEKEEFRRLNEQLLATPAVALEGCRATTIQMAERAVECMSLGLESLFHYDSKVCETVRTMEGDVDEFEDRIGSYLVKLTNQDLSDADSHTTTILLRLIGDFERISDHAANLVDSAEEMQSKGIVFSDEAQGELDVLMRAIREILDLTLVAFGQNNLLAAMKVEPLEEVVDTLKQQIKYNHILRVQKGMCTIENGFILSDILTDLERVSDHCSNVAACLLEMSKDEGLSMHRYMGEFIRNNQSFQEEFERFQNKYALGVPASISFEETES
jgi:phosphate:Na+ symporter